MLTVRIRSPAVSPPYDGGNNSYTLVLTVEDEPVENENDSEDVDSDNGSEIEDTTQSGGICGFSWGVTIALMCAMLMMAGWRRRSSSI